jgi:hypothetical protein
VEGGHRVRASRGRPWRARRRRPSSSTSRIARRVPCSRR